MNRAIETHKVEGDLPQNQLKIIALDEPGAGGANHTYLVGGFDVRKNASVEALPYPPLSNFATYIMFQNGPIKDAGLNGVTQEALLAIVIDRLEAFQAGPFPSAENADALAHCQFALGALQTRTHKRLARGVEGTLNP